MNKVFFHYADTRIQIKNSKKIKYFISKIFEKEKVPVDRVDYIFCSDKYLLDLNKKMLRKNYYTDILSFSMNERNLPIIGEIYISVDRVRENSKEYRVSLKQEILRVLFHGVLHFCGYHDRTKKEKEVMRLLENKYLLLLNASKLFHVKHIYM